MLILKWIIRKRGAYYGMVGATWGIASALGLFVPFSFVSVPIHLSNPYTFSFIYTPSLSLQY
jgi:hypothetical protein